MIPTARLRKPLGRRYRYAAAAAAAAAPSASPWSTHTREPEPDDDEESDDGAQIGIAASAPARLPPLDPRAELGQWQTTLTRSRLSDRHTHEPDEDAVSTGTTSRAAAHFHVGPQSS
jgi:hypothetical protein